MLAIRELQCKQNVLLSFAFVNEHGIGPFSTMEPQCFFGKLELCLCIYNAHIVYSECC